MICRTCNNPIPNEYLACPYCAVERAKAGVRRYQHHPLRKVAEGQATLTIRFVDGTRHVQMFGADVAFCYKSLEFATKRNTVTFEQVETAVKHPLDFPGVCLDCCREVVEVMNEALCSA